MLLPYRTLPQVLTQKYGPQQRHTHHKAPTLPSPEPSDVLRHPLLPSTLQPLHPSEIPGRSLQWRHQVQLHSLQSAPNSAAAQHDQHGCPAGIAQSISGRVCWFWERPRGSSLQLPTSQPPGLSLKAAPTSSSSQSCLQKPVSTLFPLCTRRG